MGQTYLPVSPIFYFCSHHWDHQSLQSNFHHLFLWIFLDVLNHVSITSSSCLTRTHLFFSSNELTNNSSPYLTYWATIMINLRSIVAIRNLIRMAYAPQSACGLTFNTNYNFAFMQLFEKNKRPEELSPVFKR